MIASTSAKDKVEHHSGETQIGISELRAAQQIFRQDHKQGWADLDRLFRTGMPPEPMLNGRYAGELLAIAIAPGLTQFFQWLTDNWMPWLGKTFNSAQQSGDNMFAQDSYPLARLFNPFYRGFVTEGTWTYRCFTFHTYLAPGLADQDRAVLKIDYDLDGNPAPTIRRILDELVQLADRCLFSAVEVSELSSRSSKRPESASDTLRRRHMHKYGFWLSPKTIWAGIHSPNRLKIRPTTNDT